MRSSLAILFSQSGYRVRISGIEGLAAHQQQQIATPVHLLRQRRAYIAAAENYNCANLHRLRIPLLDGRQSPKADGREYCESNRRQVHVTVTNEVAIAKVSQVKSRSESHNHPQARECDSRIPFATIPVP